MKTRIYTFITGFIVTLLVSGFSLFYLRHQKQKKAFESQSPYLDFVETMDARFNDNKYPSVAKNIQSDKVVLLAVDDESIKEVGRWPWNRSVMADLLTELFDYKIKAVGLDVIFSEAEHERDSGDAKLGKVLENHADKIVLGAFSDNLLKTPAYQDYCVNEAFLQNGGADLVKINPSLVVDDIGDNFEDMDWGSILPRVFERVRQNSENEYLKKVNKDKNELSVFQKNYLSGKKTKDVFDYCTRWLTKEDEIYNNYRTHLIHDYQVIFDKKDGFKGLDLDHQVEKFKAESKDLPFPQYGEWQGNIQDLQKPSLYTGSFVTQLDLDGYVRRYPTFYRSGNKLGTSYIPSLALQTYIAATGYRADVKLANARDKKRIVSFLIKDPSTEPERTVQELPVDNNGRLLINYYGPAYSLPYVSAKDLFSEDETINVLVRSHDSGYGHVYFKSTPVKKSEFFKDKTVILGVTAVALYDLRNTPVAANYPGPEIHLTVLNNLFNQQFIQRLHKEDVIIPLALFIFGILLSIGLMFMGPAQSVVGMLATMTLFYFLDQAIFERWHVVYSSLFFMLEIPLVSFSILVLKYATEEKKKNEIRKMFSKYVAPAVVDELLKNDDNLKLGGRKQNMSVFFSDVRGFTEFSEKMDPQELSRFLSEYLTPMTEIIFKNKGTLDKYMGDGLMAFFGAPVFFETHAHAACRSALQSIEELKKMQIEFAQRQWPKIDIGIGINSGPMSVGNMGSKIVQSYTVIGDAVNLGSRIEGANKEYGTRILISENTYKEVKNDFITREVDLLRVKGKKEPIKTYELIAEKADENMQDWLKAYDQAYTSYQKHHFEVALKQFEKIEKAYPFDTVSKLYKKRCEQFIAEPPSLEWDGVFEMKTK